MTHLDASGISMSKMLERAEYVFVLPNQPIAPEEGAVQRQGYVAALIEANGNHWRKIMTIMAKLTAVELTHWRQWRDEMLNTKVAVVFSSDAIASLSARVFFVGNGFREQVPVPAEANVLGERHRAFMAGRRIWCPYLDYRQFPNVLIDELRLSMHNQNMESACFMS
ncbi:DUF6942 family protein [Marinomonas pollencensis]|nr:hypothetical protein [Marinomonas pollencensis]